MTDPKDLELNLYIFILAGFLGKKVFEQVAAKVLPNGGVLYLYHRRMFFPHTTKLQGFKPMPDGLLRVVGLKI